jgi:hypothetical protein
MPFKYGAASETKGLYILKKCLIEAEYEAGQRCDIPWCTDQYFLLPRLEAFFWRLPG